VEQFGEGFFLQFAPEALAGRGQLRPLAVQGRRHCSWSVLRSIPGAFLVTPRVVSQKCPITIVLIKPDAATLCTPCGEIGRAGLPIIKTADGTRG